MVQQVLLDSINLLHIIFFVYINVLYGYLAIRVWKRKTDRAAKLILFLFYIVFSVEFLNAVLDENS
jgi:hypothetical protein